MGRVEGEWIINPTFTAREKSEFDLVVAGLADKVLMLEAEGNQVGEVIVYEAIEFSLKHIKKIISYLIVFQRFFVNENRCQFRKLPIGERKDESDKIQLKNQFHFYIRKDK